MAAPAEIRGPLVYLDANIFIYALEDLAAFGDKVRHAFATFDRQRLRVVTSELTLAEVLVRPIRAGDDAIRTTYEDFIGGRGPADVIPVSRGIF